MKPLIGIVFAFVLYGQTGLCIAEANALGTIVTSGKVVIGTATAPTGTTFFSGDFIKAANFPALISFTSGSRVEMVAAEATFARQGSCLIMQPRLGIFVFNFPQNECVRIITPQYSFTSLDSVPHQGTLALNSNGQVALSLKNGNFEALNIRGVAVKVSPSAPFTSLSFAGLGTVTTGRDTLIDPSKSWEPDELEGQVIRIGNQTYRIAGNGEHLIHLDGAWGLSTGSYEYQISGAVAVVPPLPSQTAKAAGQAFGLSPDILTTIVPQVGTFTATSVLLDQAEKTPSSR